MNHTTTIATTALLTLALAGCAPGGGTEDPAPAETTASAPESSPAASASPSVDRTSSMADWTEENATQPAQEYTEVPVEDSPVELDKSAHSANISTLSEATTAQYGLIPDEYWPTVDDPGLFCAASNTSYCASGRELTEIWFDHFDDPDTGAQ